MGKLLPSALLSSLGVDLAIDYKAMPVFSEPVLEFTHGKGIDLIFDPVMSGPHFNEVSISWDSVFRIFPQSVRIPNGLSTAQWVGLNYLTEPLSWSF